MNRLKGNFIYGLIVIFLLVGCSVPTKQDVANMWVGKNISEAIAVLGPPTYTTALPDQVTIYTWQKRYGITTSGARCITGLHANKEGVIIDASQLSESLLCD